MSTDDTVRASTVCLESVPGLGTNAPGRGRPWRSGMDGEQRDGRQLQAAHHARGRVGWLAARHGET